MADNITIVSLHDLQNEGKVTLNPSADALIYIEDGDDSLVIRWGTLLQAIVNAIPTPTVDFPGPFPDDKRAAAAGVQRYDVTGQNGSTNPKFCAYWRSKKNRPGQPPDLTYNTTVNPF